MVFTPTTPPAELLLAMQAGHEQALNALWKGWSHKVQLFVRMQLQPSGLDANHLAQEVVADVFHDVWRHPQRFDGRVAFNTWLFTLARYKAIDRLRLHLRRDAVETPVDDEELGGFVDDAPRPDELLGTGQTRAAIQRCLGRLRNHLQREALMLSLIEEMPLADIAHLQDCPENTVKTRLFHGRKNMRGCLQQSLSLESLPA